MFIIELTYKVDLALIDAAMNDHMVFVREQYKAGVFLMSGRKVPRDGGVIIAIGHDRQQMDALMRTDPFVARGLVDYRIVEFRASQSADDLPARFK